MTPEPFSPLETYSKNTIFSNCSRPFVTRTGHTPTETDFCLCDLRRQKKVITLRKLDIFTAHKAYAFCMGKVAQAEISLNVCVCPRL